MKHLIRFGKGSFVVAILVGALLIAQDPGFSGLVMLIAGGVIGAAYFFGFLIERVFS